MSRLLITLEEKFGALAIPQLVRMLMSLQVLVWCLTQLQTGDSGLLRLLIFDPELVTGSHQWWRCLSFLLFPTGGGLLWIFMGVPFMWMVSDGLEEAWGAFRVNLYLLACVICVVAEGFLHGSAVGSPFAIFASLIMAYAVYFPDQEIRLYGLIPLKMKWIGLIDFGFLLFQGLGSVSMRWHIIASLLPFFAVFGPGLSQLIKHKTRVIERRHRYASAQLPANAHLHQCIRCGKTEKEHPQLDFRVNAEGNDVCSECRAAAKT